MKTIQNEGTNSAPTFTSCVGRIRACVWESQIGSVCRHKITLSKLVREDSGNWQRGRTFWGSELAQVVEAVGKAQGWIENRRRQLEFPRQPVQAPN